MNEFNIIKNLEDKKFECKLDILNCLISLIFITEQGFKSYANICLFRVLDYLTDEQWIKRKLSVNIVYTLVFFCKEEIMPVKNNIIEFLNLKDRSTEEVSKPSFRHYRPTLQWRSRNPFLWDSTWWKEGWAVRARVPDPPCRRSLRL